MTERLVRAVSHAVTHGGALAVVGALLLSAGQPIFTDDLWWHLAIGGDYAAHGPWLEADPFLFTAERPPDPAAWLADLALHGVHRLGGFTWLRLLHVALVAVVLGLGWTMLRRASGSTLFASLGTAVFAALSAYRLFQLRPHLFTVLAALAVVRLLVLDRRPPTTLRIAAATAVFALWANAHGAFLVGLVLIGAAAAAAVGQAVVGGAPGAAVRARRLVLALVLAALATVANPSGPAVWMPFTEAGADTPELAVVADEWARVALFSWPLPHLPPTPLAWALVWCLLVAAPLAVALQWRAARRGRGGGDGPGVPDPALLAVGAASLAGMLMAVRLLWLGLFVLLVVGAAGRALAGAAPPPGAPRVRGARAWAAPAAALVTCALVPGFLRLGDWPMISQGVARATYAVPYSTAKYHAHAVWFLRDTRLEGRLYAEYWMGNFLGYWLAPRLGLFVNGSLNVPGHVMTASRVIAARAIDAAGRTTPELLDEYGLDVFLGTGVPVVPPPGRPLSDTTRHLAATPGWVAVFRNMQSAVYLRDMPRNRRNLERIRGYYVGLDVPFDVTTGFDAVRAVREAPGWAAAHGLVPGDFARIEHAAEHGPPATRRVARNRLASIHALLGDYDGAVGIDRLALADEPGAIPVLRRLVWCLLHAGRLDEANAAAERLAEAAGAEDALSRRIVDAARRSPAVSEAERRALLASLPVFTRPQGRWAVSGFASAAPRPGRR